MSFPVGMFLYKVPSRYLMTVLSAHPYYFGGFKGPGAIQGPQPGLMIGLAHPYRNKGPYKIKLGIYVVRK